MLYLQPDSLQDLFAAFDELNRGQTVLLGAPAPGEDRSVTSAPLGDPPASLGFFSSGSTGRPKLIWRRWNELLTDARVDANWHGWTWASSFAPTTFAGVQVALQAWCTHGNALSLGTNWPATWRELVSEEPAALSSTPTFLDLLLQHEEKPVWTPRQITLGGEVLRHSSGQRFRDRFPNTRFTVIYASAEHGILFKTHRLDGWYELEFLAKRGVRWRVQDDVLELFKEGTWVSTNDQVELWQGAIRPTGRVDSVANVGGVKVNLEEIGRLAEQVSGVRRAIAWADSNPVVGQVVALKYALEPHCSPGEVQARLEVHLRMSLRKEAWPRRWELDAVGLGPNSKRVTK